MENEEICKSYAFPKLHGDLQSLKTFLAENYCDPDRVRIKKGKPEVENKEYYEDICEFLDFREKELIEESKQYTYKLNKGGLIEVMKRKKHQFYLKTDQFGFSIPFQNGGIYDDYLMDCNGDGEDFVKQCIKDTRSIGGSFVWALEEDDDGIELNPTINYQRGSLRKQQDRVDLTLWLIKVHYETVQSLKGPKIKSLNERNIKAWLDHFESFCGYVKFFMLEDFVNPENDIPWSIVKSEIVKNGKMQIEDPTEERKEFKNLNSEGIEKVLNNVRGLTLSRSEKIKTYVNQRRNSGIDHNGCAECG